MPKKIPEKNSGFIKYVLVDKPIFLERKEGAKFILSRNKNKSYALSIKKFFAKPLMRMEAKKHITKILSSNEFKNERSAKELLKKINEIPFWRGVKVEEFKKVMSNTSLDKITEFVESNKNEHKNTKKNNLIKSLFSELPDLEKSYKKYKTEYVDKIPVYAYEEEISFEESKEKIDSHEFNNYLSSDSNDEEFSLFESEEKTDSDLSETYSPSAGIESADHPKPTAFEKHISQENTSSKSVNETPSVQTNSVNLKKFQNEKYALTKEINEKIKKEKEQLEILQCMEKNELERSMQQDSIATVKELENLKKLIDLDVLKERIQTKLESMFEKNEEKNRNIYEGLNELISHANNLKKECSIEGNRKITAFMSALEKLEDKIKDSTDLEIHKNFVDIFALYTEKYEAARLKGQLAEIAKVMYPESEEWAIKEKQQKLAGEIRAKLKEISVFNRYPDELDAFADYFKNPDMEFDEERREYYAAFLRIFYENIQLLDKNTQTQCLNVADQLEGELQYDAQIDFGLFDTDDMETKQPEFFDLITALQDYDAPSSSLLSFFEYLKNGKSTINKISYWKLLQFSVNRSSAMQVLLKFDDLDFFKSALQRLNADLRLYANIKNIK